MARESISWAEWNPTMICPAVFAAKQPEIKGNYSGCTYCYAAPGMPHTHLDRLKFLNEELSTRQALNLLDDLAERQIPRLSFLGGEPQSRTDFKALIAHAREKFKLVSVTTNGVGTKRNHEALMQASVVEVSLDSHDFQTAIKTRPAAIVKAALDTIESLKTHPFLCLSSVVTPGSLEKLPDFISWAFQKGIKRINLYPLLGNSDVPEQLALTDTQAIKLLTDLESMYPTYGERVCKAGKHVVVNHDGTILPCAAFLGENMSDSATWQTIDRFSEHDFSPLAPNGKLESPGCPGKKLHDSNWSRDVVKTGTNKVKAEQKLYCMRCNYPHLAEGGNCQHCGFEHFDKTNILMMCSAFTVYNPKFFPKQ